MSSKRAIQRIRQKQQIVNTAQGGIEAARREGYKQGQLDEYALLKPFYDSREALHSTCIAIATASMCSHGENTKQVILNAKNHLQHDLSHFENTVYAISKVRHIEIPEEFAEDMAELRRLLSQYANHPEPENQKAIRDYMQKVTFGFEAIFPRLKKTEKRGRPADVVKLAIGGAVLAYGKPEQLKAYIQGERLYRELCGVPSHIRSDEQTEMYNQLKLYMVEGGDYAAQHKRRDLGIYIKEARALALKPREIESGN